MTITSPADGSTFSTGEIITFSGTASDTKDGDLTDNNGQVIFQSDRVKNPASGTTFTITIDSVSKTGWIYDPANSVNSSSISV